MARITWVDPTGNTGQGTGWLPVKLAKIVARAYEAEVPGRKVTLEYQDVVVG